MNIELDTRLKKTFEWSPSKETEFTNHRRRKRREAKSLTNVRALEQFNYSTFWHADQSISEQQRVWKNKILQEKSSYFGLQNNRPNVKMVQNRLNSISKADFDKIEQLVADSIIERYHREKELIQTTRSQYLYRRNTGSVTSRIIRNNEFTRSPFVRPLKKGHIKRLEGTYAKKFRLFTESCIVFVEILEKIRSRKEELDRIQTVSYTHLTLPTIYSV
eukprot:TRINITY_DN20352_c0_g1_i1.p1 TRINITY_DN20352_c0_g1~~TRINITY_DN20352_c0_g1_i1.p1  ORF type:complete len:218 (+),score=27.93 TRINITY_DN20352_c0_g1_i1:378-1031(+)